MPRRVGSRQQQALAQIVANGPGLRSTVRRAQTSAGRSGNVSTELQRMSARGNTNATTVLNLMRRAGAGTGGGAGSTGG